jgi:hypothetical protein
VPAKVGCASCVLAFATLWSCDGVYAQNAPSRAQVGPLQAWVARAASGVCQLNLHNVADVTVVAWTVTVRSEDARFISVFRQDGWRDRYHLPSAALTLSRGDTTHHTVNEDGALGALEVRIHLLVREDDVAHGMAEYAAHVSPAPIELRSLQERRRSQASQALALAHKIDGAIAREGVAAVLASKLASSALDNDGDWNWWHVSEAVKAAEALSPTSPKAAADLSAALDRLRDAHRRGTAPMTLHLADPMRPLAVGRCDP